MLPVAASDPMTDVNVTMIVAVKACARGDG